MEGITASVARLSVADGFNTMAGAMDTVAPQERRYTSGNLSAFVTSFCAAIVVGLGLAIVVQASIFSMDHLFRLGSTFFWVASAINAIFSLWLFTWTFARSWHVEQRLQQGLDIGVAKLSILANLRSAQAQAVETKFVQRGSDQT
jgi:hypothetical protein